MSSAQPTIRQVKWISLIPQLSIMGVLIYIYCLIKVSDPVLYGILTYLSLSIALRQIIPRYHRKGISYYKVKQYEKAIVEFKKSYEFFKKHRWIDKNRFIVLLSSSRISYLEMSLINIAFCYGQLGDGKKSKQWYEKALSEFPDSQMAITALKMLDAGKSVE